MNETTLLGIETSCDETAAAAALAALGRAALLAHGQANALARDVNLGHPHPHHIAGFHHLMRILDETVGELADMHQPVLMHADVDKGAEFGDVGH